MNGKNYKKITGLVTIALLLACALIPNVSAAVPTVTTFAATGVEETNATMFGNLTDLNSNSYTWVSFRYGPTTAYATGNTTRTNKTALCNYTVNVSSLTAGKLYHYTAVGNCSTDVGYGSDRWFITKPVAITGFTVTTVSSDAIALNWTLGTGGIGCYVEYSTSSVDSWSKGDGTVIGNINGSSYTHSSLSPGTSYFYKAWEYAFNYSKRSTGNATTPYADSPGTGSATTLGLNSPGSGGSSQSSMYSVKIVVYDGSSVVPSAGVTLGTHSGTTNNNGEVTLYNIDYGTYSLSVSKSGYQVYHEQVIVTGNIIKTIHLIRTSSSPGTFEVGGDSGSGLPGFELVVLIGAIAVSFIIIRKKKQPEK